MTSDLIKTALPASRKADASRGPGTGLVPRRKPTVGRLSSESGARLSPPGLSPGPAGSSTEKIVLSGGLAAC